MAIKEKESSRWFRLVKGKTIVLEPETTKDVWVKDDSAYYGRSIRKLRVIDDHRVALYDLLGTRLVPTNDYGGVRPIYNWDWRTIEREVIQFRTTNQSIIFWEEI